MKLTAFPYLDTHALDSKAIHLRPVEKILCDACPLKSKCTSGKSGRAVDQRFDEERHDRVLSYRGTFPYEKAQQKHKAGSSLSSPRQGGARHEGSGAQGAGEGQR